MSTRSNQSWSKCTQGEHWNSNWFNNVKNKTQATPFDQDGSNVGVANFSNQIEDGSCTQYPVVPTVSSQRHQPDVVSVYNFSLES